METPRRSQPTRSRYVRHSAIRITMASCSTAGAVRPRAAPSFLETEHRRQQEAGASGRTHECRSQKCAHGNLAGTALRTRPMCQSLTASTRPTSRRGRPSLDSVSERSRTAFQPRQSPDTSPLAPTTKPSSSNLRARWCRQFGNRRKVAKLEDCHAVAHASRSRSLAHEAARARDKMLLSRVAVSARAIGSPTCMVT